MSSLACKTKNHDALAMMLFRRRLFWKVYLTLLVSLLAVAIISAGSWWVLGRAYRAKWGTFHVTLADGGSARSGPVDTSTPDVTLYGSDGTLIAAHGRPVEPIGDRGDALPRQPTLRIDLPDGRMVLARLRPPVGEPGIAITILLLIVAGGVGLAALPITARLTRRLERLRGAMARWGDGDHATRVDEHGNDEVALVARTFNVAARRLDALLASQRALLANASHELRSPLTRLRVAIDLWLRAPDETMRGEIVKSLAEIDHLVAEILLHSRLEHPSFFLGPLENVDLLGLSAEEALRFDAAVSGEAVEIDGDVALLRRLLRNLLENAVKHGRAPISVSVAYADGKAQIIVADQGQGIAPEERERVFEPFYRPSGHDEAGGGWGLGLSLVRHIADLHGGRVTCDTEPGSGSRFIVSFPRAGA